MSDSVERRVTAAIEALSSLSHLNVVTHDRRTAAVGEAREMDATGPGADQPLFGQPIVVKGNIEVAGLPFDGGSPALAGVVGQVDAPVVARLRRAGAIVVAITNMHELAFGITSANAHFGSVASPLNPRHMAGGSSGGTAAAVGAGAVRAGLGTDTGGSGRLPAAMCGCVGLRPTSGRYDGTHLLTLSQTLDTVAPFGADVAQVSALDAVLSGDADEVEMPAPGTLRIGVVDDPYWMGLDAGMDSAGRAALKRLSDAGITLVPLDAPEVGALTEASAFPIALHETRENWITFARDLKGQTLGEFAATLSSPDVRGLFEALARGELPDQAAYDAAMQEARPKLQERMRRLFAENGLDAMISPALVAPAPLLGQVDEVMINGSSQPLFEAMTARALIASVAAVPAVTIPFGQGPGDLPLVMELVGAAGADRHLLAVARVLEGLTA